jgi:hypothetical protein
MADALGVLLRIFCLVGVILFVFFCENEHRSVQTQIVNKLRNVLEPNIYYQDRKSVKLKVVIGFIKNTHLAFGYGPFNRRFCRRRIMYYNNHDAYFQLQLLFCGDIHLNPGPNNSNNDEGRKSTTENRGSKSKMSVFYSNAKSIVNKVMKLQLELAKMQVI